GLVEPEPHARLQHAAQADACADLVEVDVARVLDPLDQVLSPVYAVTAAIVAEQADAAGARNWHVLLGLDHTEIERHACDGELPRRRRRLSRRDDSIQ